MSSFPHCSMGDRGTGGQCVRRVIDDIIAGATRRLPNWRSCMTFTRTRSRPDAPSCLRGLVGVFGSDSATEESEPAIEVKSLHAKIGQLTLVTDFSAGALGKAGLCRAQNDNRSFAQPGVDAADREIGPGAGQPSHLFSYPGMWIPHNLLPSGSRT